MKRHAIHDRRHAELAHAVVDVTSALLAAAPLAASAQEVGRVGVDWVGNDIVIEHQMSVTLSTDHRCVDGALGVAMGIFQINSNQNVFWIMLTIFIVLGPDRASSWQKALKRSGGVIVGALVISGLSEVLPAEVIFGLAAFALLGGVLYLQRNYTVWAAGITFVVLTLFGAQDHDFIIWAERRVVDTLIGATIALLVGYLVLPDRKQKG